MQSLAHWLIWNEESYGDMHRAQRRGPLCLGACQILGSAQRTSRTLLSALTLVLEVEGEESSLLILPAPHPASLSLYSKHSRPSCTCFCGGKKLLNSTNQIWARFSWRRETNLTLHMRVSGLTQCTLSVLSILHVQLISMYVRGNSPIEEQSHREGESCLHYGYEIQQKKLGRRRGNCCISETGCEVLRYIISQCNNTTWPTQPPSITLTWLSSSYGNWMPDHGGFISLTPSFWNLQLGLND